MQVGRSGICQDGMKIHSSYLHISCLNMKTYSIRVIGKKLKIYSTGTQESKTFTVFCSLYNFQSPIKHSSIILERILESCKEQFMSTMSEIHRCHLFFLS